MTKEITIENLKCCGNCKHRHSIEVSSHTDETCKKIPYTAINSYELCEQWEFDNLQWHERLANAHKK